MAEIVWYVFSGSGATVTLIAGALWLWRRPHSTHPRRFLIGAMLFYAISSSYAITHLLERALWIGLTPITAAEPRRPRTALVVLGSGSVTTRDWDETRFSQVDPWAASRVLEAARLFRLLDPEWVISSGGLPHPDEDEEPTGKTMEATLRQLGVPASRIMTETRSRTTREEAVIVAPMLTSIGAERVILVTSAPHMRRSLGAFRTEGVTAIPAIARNPFLYTPWDVWVLPSDAGLQSTAFVAHEVLGLIYYTLRGWYR